jgi:hypothetical protein
MLKELQQPLRLLQNVGLRFSLSIFGFRSLLSKVEELKQPCLIENVGGVDEDVASIVLNQTKSSSLSNVENVHLEFGNVTLLDIDNVLQLVVVTMPKGGIYD